MNYNVDFPSLSLCHSGNGEAVGLYTFALRTSTAILSWPCQTDRFSSHHFCVGWWFCCPVYFPSSTAPKLSSFAFPKQSRGQVISIQAALMAFHFGKDPPWASKPWYPGPYCWYRCTCTTPCLFPSGLITLAGELKALSVAWGSSRETQVFVILSLPTERLESTLVYQSCW